jgi:uncharacterized protein YcbK (DUF882 family)
MKDRHRVYGGLNPRQEHIFTWFAVVIILLFMTAWVGAYQEVREEQRQFLADQKEAAAMRKAAGLPPRADEPPPTPTQRMASAILDSNAPTTAYITDAMLGFTAPLHGYSGELRFATRTPGATIVPGAPDAASAVLTDKSGAKEEEPDFQAPDEPGVYNMTVKLNEATREVQNFSLITLVPFAQKQQGKIGLYFLGSWPFEGGGTPRTPAYANPSGFIEVTQENQNTQISEHFRLRDFLTKNQPGVWPKYLLLNPNLLDKLELTIQELEAEGIAVKHVQIMSGFRTPQYNHTGGNTAGRANLSRHMYGDASDIFVDNDGNGVMDDLNHDGRSDIRDAQVISAAVDRVERKYPALVGGVGVYVACCGHGPFTHIDVRGFRARWQGTTGG